MIMGKILPINNDIIAAKPITNKRILLGRRTNSNDCLDYYQPCAPYKVTSASSKSDLKSIDSLGLNANTTSTTMEDSFSTIIAKLGDDDGENTTSTPLVLSPPTISPTPKTQSHHQLVNDIKK
eukprot:Pgem_evm2s1126